MSDRNLYLIATWLLPLVSGHHVRMSSDKLADAFSAIRSSVALHASDNATEDGVVTDLINEPILLAVTGNLRPRHVAGVCCGLGPM
jgi:hypothetical protein